MTKTERAVDERGPLHTNRPTLPKPAPNTSYEPDDSLTYPPLRVAWATVAILLLFYAIGYVDRQILSLMALVIQSELRLTEVELGLLHGFSFVLLYAFAGFPMGWLLDRYSRRNILFLGVAIWSLACVACGLATDFRSLFLARVFVGVGEAALVPAAYSMMRDLFAPSRVSLANAVFTTGGSLGVGLSFATGGFIVHELSAGAAVSLPVFGAVQPWQLAFMIAGLPGVFAAFLVYAVPEPRRIGRPPSATGYGVSLVGFARRHCRALLTALFATSLAAMCSFSIYAWMPAYLGRQFMLAPFSIGLSMSVAVGLIAMLGSVVAGAVADRFMRLGVIDIHFRMIAAALCVSGPCCILAFLMPTPLLCVATISICGFMMGVTGALAPSALQLISPANIRGQIGAAYLLVSSLVGAGIGPLLIALLTTHLFQDPMMVGRSTSIVVISGCAIAVALLSTGLSAFRAAYFAQNYE